MWTGAKQKGGYGKIGLSLVEGTSMTACTHRIAYLLAHLHVPDDLVIRHRCDNPSCVRPDHLELGTHSDNARDSVERGRHRRGEDTSYAKLTESQALEIKRLYAETPLTQKEIAQAIGADVGRQAVGDILRGKNWRHLPKVPITSKERLLKRQRGGGSAKLTSAQVEEVKRLVASGRKQKEVALRFDIRPNHVSRLVNGVRGKPKKTLVEFV
jgi:DNA-binding CsgD family transcriptional regulator/DNA-binding XRE family transcriptional regulator